MALICLDKVTLDFPIYGADSRSLKKQLLRISTGGYLRKSDKGIVNIRALNQLSFELKPGDRVALIGHNGAGKSSLLRVLSNIYKPTSGVIKRKGAVSSLLNIRLGMNDELTGYENIKISNTIRGISKQEAERCLQDVIEFSELGDYLAMPVRTYSKGMQIRLAFALATSMVRDILLLDEVVGAGDVRFQQKARARLEGIMGKAKILVLASHSEQLLKKYCNKAIWLDAGKLVEFGDIDEVLTHYNASK